MFTKEICEALEAGTSLAVFLATKDVEEVNVIQRWWNRPTEFWLGFKGRLVTSEKKKDLKEIHKFNELECYKSKNVMRYLSIF